jgi:hypothetical protein
MRVTTETPCNLRVFMMMMKFLRFPDFTVAPGGGFAL